MACIVKYYARSETRTTRPYVPETHSLDCLSQADVIGDEEIYPRKQERLAQRFELIRIDADASPERGLEQLRVGGGDAVPAQRVDVRRELAGFVKALPPNLLPAFGVEDLAAKLKVPNDFERFTLRIVVQAGQPNNRGITVVRLDCLDEIGPGAHPDNLAGGRSPGLREICGGS